jgi:signal transduction histidine kinase
LIAAIALGAERWLAGAAREAAAALGPDQLSNGPRRLSPAARALWPAVLRLDRDWRDHAGRSEVQLAAAEAAIAAVPDPLILIDRNRRIVRANSAWTELIGSVVEPRDLASALRNPVVLAAADAVLAGEDVRTVEFAVSVPVARLLQAHLAPIEGPSLDGAAAVITLHDITALKRADEMRADFVANAGHELKTPLSTLLGFIETLRGPARDIDIELELPDELPEVQGDRDELAQVFQNLLDNAVKYARRDSTVTVTAGAADGTAPAMLWVAVADQSDGIPSDHLPRLTERFYRVDNARSRELGGTGLGLAVVKHILNRHRGRLDIASTLGRGSIFTVWLRAAE